MRTSTMPEVAPLFLRAALPVALALLAGGCKPSTDSHGGSFPPPAVTVITVEPKDVPVTYEYVAQTAGFREVEVRARVTGIVLKRNYREGAQVRQGESLFTIDPAPFQTALARNEADLAVAEARLAQTKRDEARLKPVLEAKAVSRKEYDDAISGWQVAEAEVKSAKAKVTEARLNLGYTRVEAPISGYASRAVVSEGSLVSGPNVLLTTVTQVDPMYVIFGIPDREYLALRRDVEAGRLKLPDNGRFKASVKLADGSLYPRPGAVNFTDVRVNTQTGTSEARAVFPNPGNALRAGEFVRVVLEGALRPGAIVVPQRAVLESAKGKYAYIVDAEGKSQQRPLEVGDWSGDGWIINGGLKPGDRVVVEGVVKLSLMPPGVPVKITDSAEAASGKSDAAGKSDKKAPAHSDKAGTPSAGAASSGGQPADSSSSRSAQKK
ncbi:MAG TPA: efflux RND transporter periplasmic adaptor subunit [Burkholderiales bacterium]|nr:efflux RND transporter periplasmic adaptor subunit [Burkholderiales bacterium]